MNRLEEDKRFQSNDKNAEHLQLISLNSHLNKGSYNSSKL